MRVSIWLALLDLVAYDMPGFDYRLRGNIAWQLTIEITLDAET